MYTLIEFHGRLSRSDKRPANPGRYDLLFQLHPSGEGSASLWSESLKGVEVAPGGFYYVTLGQKTPLSASLFNAEPRWLSVRVIAGGKRSDEHSSRVPVLGQLISLADMVQQIDARVQQVESALTGIGSPRSGRREGGPAQLREWAQELADRLQALEENGGGARGGQVEQLFLRLEAIDGEEGRLTHLEDELEDIVGPDGDLVDLNERMDLLEDRAPDLIANLRAREGESGKERLKGIDESIRGLRDRLTEVDRTLIELRAALQAAREAPPAGPEAIGAVKKSGDTMTGALTIQRGGLDLPSGTLTARNAEIATLEAANQIKSARVVTEAIDLRGDLLVDSAKRTLQVRHVEGRHGSGKRDGPLHLNARGGAEVVVGNAEQRAGLEVFGVVSAAGVALPSGPVGQVFKGSGLSTGDVVVLESGGQKVAHAAQAGDRRVVGVLCSGASVVLGGSGGDSAVVVALAGVVPCKVEGPVTAGDALVCGAEPGYGRASADPSQDAGAIFGKALEGLESGRGTIRVLIAPR